jgi:hypothetical protein
MNKTSILKLALTFASVAGMLFATGEATAQPPPKNPATLQGVWRVTRHGVNCQTGQDFGLSFPALMTFNQDGTLNAFAVPPGSTPAETSPEYGVWAHDDSGYSFRDVSYTYDSNGAFVGRGEITAIVELTSANTFTYTASVCVYDPAGNQLFCFCGRAEGTRF